MKYAILSLGLYKRYVAICSVTNPEKFYEEFDLNNVVDKNTFETSLDDSKAFMLSGFLKVKSKLVEKDEEYEQRCYYIIHNARDKDAIKITHGILSHKITHVCQKIKESLENEVGNEAEAYLDGSITDFVYGFFRDNEIPIYYVEDIMIELQDKHKNKLQHPIIY